MPELLEDELPDATREELRTELLREGWATLREEERALRETELRVELPARLLELRTEPPAKAEAEELLRAILWKPP